MTWRWEEDKPEDEHDTLLTLEFNEVDDGTELVLTHERFASVESRDSHAKRLDRHHGTARRAPRDRRKMMTAIRPQREKSGSLPGWILLKAEKELTRRSDELARRRQELPWVRIDKEYRFETDEGIASLADLFKGRSQLLVYHFMFGPGLHGGVPVLLVDRGRLQRLRRSPRESRRYAVRGVASSACEAAGV